ncbi:hypothetical protein [Streptomyces sp. TLI_146]|uniref:hypothetical protein n=1 Tax=Streptomyces sp. TLI_146 TaxID=1938858 RepID=UPI000C70953F|nr:hypothetical protein [Streptomyces sp. TLI_146]PKV89327.1 hypothetical protein BX283_6963 [Streptomyces sp. TLI_146]
MLLVIALLLAGGCAAVFALFANEVSKESERTATIRYEVTGHASGVAITYSTWHSGDESASQETGLTLPWSKQEKAKGFLKGGTLSVTLGPDGGTATCSVTVDDGAPKTATASGAFASAVCSGFF